MAEDQLLCTFRLAEHLIGIEISAVQEVLREQEITRLPLASAAVRGVINLRGRIVPAIDLRRCFEMEPRAARRGVAEHRRPGGHHVVGEPPGRPDR